MTYGYGSGQAVTIISQILAWPDLDYFYNFFYGKLFLLFKEFWAFLL